MFKNIVVNQEFTGLLAAKPAILLDLDGLAINSKVLDTLGNPEYIQFLWSISKRAILILEAAAKDHSAIHVETHCADINGNMNYKTLPLIRAIKNAAQLEHDKVYSVVGKYIAEHNVVAFKVESAKETEDVQYE
jgi:hypothetical protein